MKLRSGLVGEVEAPPATQELLACFTAVNGRQILAKSLLYVYHNELGTFQDLQESSRLAMIYAILSPNGISHQLKKFLRLIYEKGYLTPEDCEDSVFAKRALELYPLAHEYFQKSGKQGLHQFLDDYVSAVWKDPAVSAQELLLSGDLDEDEVENFVEEDDEDLDEEEEDEENVEENDGSQENKDDSEGPFECDCEFCEEMRELTKVDLENLKLDDPNDQRYLDLLKKQLRKE